MNGTFEIIAGFASLTFCLIWLAVFFAGRNTPDGDAAQEELREAALDVVAEIRKAGYAPCHQPCNHDWCQKLTALQNALKATRRA